MRNLTDQLQNFIADTPASEPRRVLSMTENRIFRSMKTQGERAIKGREVGRAIYEVKRKAGIAFLMIMEGRHSMSVGAQIVRRFSDTAGVDSVEVVKTKRGACVILRPCEVVDA